ncbi:unnamed protein product (macronuclear) [Paramecium tetraurelia]|uniref:Roadblock/LAMTOR2 domain-containing protein n=1 Tax=Paramecium tetraurelia TaxID=5888 RepID=A0DAW6_PARTE|nr:uncharacterized protein GSPATT00015090001 [Paramecium tetraurelia]CAK80183.1 unnamed protein product [Paramecium tetraurelia]|eukprot:XP_001447580.1 hypothetical protein (macronuclear) [Paramecium tetraurelia strain d4-2]
MSNNTVLQKFLQNNPFIEGIVLMDKEGIEIIGAFQNENNKLRTGAQSLMYVVAIQQCNENLRKLSDSETKQITLVYDEWILYFEIWSHSILIFYCNVKANIVSLKQLGQELKRILSPYNDLLEKQQK